MSYKTIVRICKTLKEFKEEVKKNGEDIKDYVLDIKNNRLVILKKKENA
jgi:hypothetical protein